MIQSLPGICRIGYIDLANVPEDVASKAMANIDIVITAELALLCSAKNAKCEWEDVESNNSHYQKATLEFHTAEDIPLDDIAFVIFTVNGDTFLMGAKEKNRMAIERKKSTGYPSGDRADFDYKAKFTATKAIVKCIIQ